MFIKWSKKLVLVTLMAASGLSSFARAEAVPAEVRFAYAGGPRVWILGKIDGSFDQAFGAKVKWIPFASGGDVLTLFAAKEIDIARFGSSPAAAGIARNLQVEVIGVPEIIATSERLIARKGIASLKDLEGKTVAFPANSTSQYAFEVAIKLAKVDRSKIKALALKPAEIVAAWKRNDIDAAYVWGPFTQQLEADGGKEIFATRDLQKDGVLIFNNYVVRKEFAQKYPELVVKFLRVAQEKVNQYKKDPEASAQLIAKHLDIPVETARSTLSGLQYPSIAEQLTVAYIGDEKTKSGSRITKAYKDTANFLAEIGDIRKSDIPDSYAASINTGFLQRALSGK
ncbi:ABC transporter substrate-binding protein [Herbaspirillum sp. RTI4]|uniref:taurine ABC transporter substrate-binding protein n=1 Tax=Herbaspirillum sp. RTI4 TaxID=3048640 RepID=UPI002AB43939|nr:glycine betaine ABC transporter substrate-binding protein [Herbaspirillum sp. RTI4]MDY7577152.1 ABC transporter substrate-binding protein [Herbaspirillum sp. RTI4]MEA9980442.1 ABC transporter substrate-binding protein [Herbaspirillum sp. RTI4]